MKIIQDSNRSFDLDELSSKPLFAHLATVEKGAPRDTPCWFQWDGEHLWIIGTPKDTFPIRINNNPKCAIGIVDFNPKTGLALHAGFRGSATVEEMDFNIAHKLLSRYLGPNKEHWDQRFKNLDHKSVLIKFKPETVVVRDQSYSLNSGGD